MLYKYMSAETANIVLRNGTLRWSTPEMLNDPFDGLFDLHIEFDRAIAKAMTIEKISKTLSGESSVPLVNDMGKLLEIILVSDVALTPDGILEELGSAIDEGFDQGAAALPNLHRRVREHINSSKVLCLTPRPSNPVMWAHYANNHTGVVLGFGSPAGVDSPWKMARPINYVESMPRLFDEDFISDLMSGRTKFSPDEIILKSLFTKSAEWSYEEERRIFAGSGRNEDASYEDIPFHHGELQQIIFGCRPVQNQKDELLELGSNLYPHAEFYEVRLGKLEFNMELTKIS